MENATIMGGGLHIVSVLARLLLAVLLGGLVGLERETKSRPAGFRTYMFVALGATMAILINQYLDYMQVGPWAEALPQLARGDVTRLGAQVVNGVGFLGAGTILVTHRREVKGITTAAGLWTSACLGLSIGAGFYACALFGVLLILACMGVFSHVEARIMARVRNMSVYMELCGPEDLGRVAARVRELGIRVYGMDAAQAKPPEGGLPVALDLSLPARETHEAALLRLSAIEGVRLIREL